MSKADMLNRFENILDEFDGEFKENHINYTGGDPDRQHYSKVKDCGCTPDFLNGNRVTVGDYQLSMPTCPVCGEAVRIELTKKLSEDSEVKNDE
ncbi:MAG: hypothetical protein ABEJ56_05675 [Candidatus Nanohaloarchaea archaeon]